MSLTEEQQIAVETRGRVIVSASAGSGKTRVMIERLVSLILSGDADVRDVLCVTFTNKAAAQMRDRLRGALLEKIRETSGDRRTRLKEQLNALPLADISTIHAFCGRLVRTHFFLVGLDPAFRIISPDDAEGKSLSARALSETFDCAYEEGGEEFSDLLAVYFRKKKDLRLRGIVLSLIGSVRGTENYRETLAKVGYEDYFEKACAYLAEDYRTRAAFLAERLKESLAFFDERNPKAAEVAADVIAACEKLMEADGLFQMTMLAETPISIRRMPPKKDASGEFLNRLNFLSGASKAVKELYRELIEYADRDTEYARYENANRRARALAALALGYDENYTRLKREANVLDYDDLEHFALEILKNDSARAELNKKYKFVFVDEYQDVNPVQESILSAVGTDEVFLVGDAKQAIYGFRGSRSDYFLEKTKAFEKSLQLTANFRSATEVLGAVNHVFAPVIAGYVPMNGGARYGEYKGEVCFHRVEEEEREEAERGIYSVLSGSASRTDALAEQVASLVEAEYGSEFFDADKGETRMVDFGDIAVLVRKNTGDAERIVRALTARDIPVTSSSRVNVCDFFEARLLLDWLSYLDNAEQDIPFATALLSAIGGFTEEELAKIRLRFPSPYTFRAACKEYAQKMRTPVSEKLNGFYKVSEELRALASVRTAAEMMGGLLGRGLEAQIAAKQGGRERMKRVYRLIAEAEQAGSVHDFLSRLKASDYHVDFSESGGKDAVKVHTMHASKGLEYPVVILAGMDANFHGADRDEVMWTEEFHAAPRCYDIGNKTVYDTLLRRAATIVQQRREVQEEGNLFYVAMTRARYRLHMLFGDKERALAPQYAKRFSDFVDPALFALYGCEGGGTPHAALKREMFGYRPDENLVRQIDGVYCKTYPFEQSTKVPVKSSATALMKQENIERAPAPAPRAEGERGGYTADTGTAYHLFLEHVEFGKDACSELLRMRENGILSETQCALLDEEKLKTILEIPCLKALAGKRTFREQTFLVRLQADEVLDTEAADDVIFQGAIDLLCEDENGYTIIDYKFSSHGDERIRTDYAKQIALYKKAVARAKRVDENKVRARIVNIAQMREIVM